MISVKEYKANPCRSLSIPYWKAKNMSLPSDIKIVHNNEFNINLLDNYCDKRFFRLKHSLKNIPDYDTSDITIDVITPDRINELSDCINKCYKHTEIRVSPDYIRSLTETEVYCPELWIGAFSGQCLIGSILCDFDRETGEGIIEWLQVLPKYRGRGTASALICRALKSMRIFADFATVSGECDNVTNPESVYRKCNFNGNDVWHILTKKAL